MSRGRNPRKGGSHLPPGHAPGAQTKSEKIARPFGVALVALFALGFLGVAIALLAMASSKPKPSDFRIGAAIFGAGALVLVPLAYWLWRRSYPRRARYLELRVEPVEARRGDTVTATLTVENARKLGMMLELALVCTEYYDIKTTVNTAQSVSGWTARKTESLPVVDDARTLDRAQLQQSQQFQIPPDALCSYEGGAVSWAWRVEARDRHRYDVWQGKMVRRGMLSRESLPPDYRPPPRFANLRPHRADAFCDVPIWVSP